LKKGRAFLPEGGITFFEVSKEKKGETSSPGGRERGKGNVESHRLRLK